MGHSKSSPRSDDLRSFSYVVLAMVGRGGGSGPELAEQAGRAAPIFWTGGASQMYAELRRLARLGYLHAEKTPARTRHRTTYHLTQAGRDAIRDWIGRPSSYPRIQHEAGVRVAAADLGDDGALLESLRALRAQLPRLEQLVAEVEQRAARYPHRARYLRLEMSLGRRLINAHHDWIDEVEQTLGGPARPPRDD